MPADPISASVRNEDRSELSRISDLVRLGDRKASARALVRAAETGVLDNPFLQYAKGLWLLASDRFVEATRAFETALSQGCPEPNLFVELGWARFRAGDSEGALKALDSATGDAANTALWQLRRARVLATLARHQDAVEACVEALKLDHQNVDAMLVAGDVLNTLGDCRRAEGFYRKALAVDERRASVWNGLAISLGKQDRHVEALKAVTRADELDMETGERSGAYINLGIQLRQQGEYERARELYLDRLAEDPRPEARCELAYTSLVLGDFEHAWADYEFRWFLEPLASMRAMTTASPWRGQPVAGKTVLLRAEQGFGDTIQFIRYARALKHSGAIVILAVQPELRTLARSFKGVDRILENGEKPQFDFYINLLSLPLVFGTTIHSIPVAVPYVAADLRKREAFRRRIGGDDRFKVGLVWAGREDHARDRYRSIPLATLAGAFTDCDVRLISLQKGAATEQLRGVSLDIVDFGSELADFSDTAALISEIDLVISVDTAVAHLAGALAKPVWLLVADPPEWRWMLGREDSPWYPTMKIFRQSEPRDWPGVCWLVRDTVPK